MENKIDVKNYVLNTEMYEDFYAILNRETGQEIFKISKKGNDVAKLQQMWPNLEVNNMIFEEGGKGVIMSVDKDAEQVVKGLWYVDGKYIDDNGKEYVSPEEYLKEKEENNEDQ